jgi:hypothetical protein
MRAITLARLVGHLWASPNTLLALCFGLGGKFAFDRENRVIVAENGWMARLIHRFGYAGMCVGDVVLSPYDIRRYEPRIYRHELVHATQARMLGPLYLPLTFLGYAIGALIYPRCPHDASPLEVWADAASGNADYNQYLNRIRSRKKR